MFQKFLQYFEINLDEELSDVVKPSHEINNGSLVKMGFVKANGSSVSKDDNFVGVVVGPSDYVNDDCNMQALVAFEPHVDHGVPMSQFESLMINLMIPWIMTRKSTMNSMPKDSNIWMIKLRLFRLNLLNSNMAEI